MPKSLTVDALNGRFVNVNYKPPECSDQDNCVGSGFRHRLKRYRRMKTMLTSILLCLVSLPALLRAQTFDNSANGTFKGVYYLRHVLLSGVDQTTGAIGRARSLI